MTIEYDRNGSGFPIPEQNEPSEASSGDAAAKTGKPAKRSDGKGRKSNKGARKAAKTKTSRTVRDASQGGAKSGQPADVSGDFADLLALLEDRAGAGKGSGKMARRGAETGLLWTLSALALAACGGGGGGGGPTVKAPPPTGGNTNTGGGPVFGGTLQSKLDFGDLTHVWFKNSTNAATGHTDNDASTNDTIIYAGNATNTDADTSRILAILEDYTDDLVTGDLLGSVVLTEV